MKKVALRNILLTTMVVLTFIACGGAEQTSPAQQASESPAAQPAPTATPVPAPTATPVPAPTATPVPAPTATPVPAPTATPVSPGLGVNVAGGEAKLCDWATNYEIKDGFLHLSASGSPGNSNMQSVGLDFAPVIKGVNRPIFNETQGFALHEYSQQALDISSSSQKVAIPKSATRAALGTTGANKMDLKITLTGKAADGRACQKDLYEAYTRGDDYYPASGEIVLPANATPDYDKYKSYAGKIPAPTAQAVVLATANGDWNDNWTTEQVAKSSLSSLRIALFGDVGTEDYETVRDLMEIFAVVAPDLDFKFAKTFDEVNFPVHFVTCTEQIAQDDRHCRVDGPSGALAGERQNNFFIRISGQRFNRHTLTHEIGHALGLFHWNLKDCSMGYGYAQTQWLSEWDLMAIAALQHSKSSWGQSRDAMREALGVSKDAQWTSYSENPDSLGAKPDDVWVELGSLLKTQALNAINRTQPKNN